MSQKTARQGDTGKRGHLWGLAAALYEVVTREAAVREVGARMPRRLLISQT